MNKTKIEELFDQEAIYIGTSDAVPFSRAVELFGKDAANFGKSIPGTSSNSFGVASGTLKYLKKAGFFMAASYANVEQAVEQENHSKGALTKCTSTPKVQ